ncbi:hypothetical protein D3C75_1147620 [compost metagenome]
MRRQHQHIIRHAPAQLAQRIKPLAHRIGVRLCRLHRDVGGDAGQHLIARYQQLSLRVVKAGVLRRMACADQHLPAMSVNLELLAVLDAPIAVRQGR